MAHHTAIAFRESLEGGEKEEGGGEPRNSWPFAPAIYRGADGSKKEKKVE